MENIKNGTDHLLQFPSKLKQELWQWPAIELSQASNCMPFRFWPFRVWVFVCYVILSNGNPFMTSVFTPWMVKVAFNYWLCPQPQVWLRLFYPSNFCAWNITAGGSRCNVYHYVSDRDQKVRHFSSAYHSCDKIAGSLVWGHQGRQDGSQSGHQWNPGRTGRADQGRSWHAWWWAMPQFHPHSCFFMSLLDNFDGYHIIKKSIIMANHDMVGGSLSLIRICGRPFLMDVSGDGQTGHRLWPAIVDRRQKWWLFWSINGSSPRLRTLGMVGWLPLKHFDQNGYWGHDF